MRRILVTGAGVSGTGAAELLTQLGADVTVADDNASARQRVAEATGARALTTAEAQSRFSEVDLVVTSPGWRPDTPILLAAAEAGLEVIGDVELAFRLDRAEVFGPPRTWLAITGTNGKTTTTAMLADIMSAHGATTGRRARAVGNIGLSVADALTSYERVDILVAELSSFQLHWSSQLAPDAGVLLNLAEDHLDWHGSFAAYAADKAKILTGDVAVIGADDSRVAAQVARVRPDALGFTAGEPAVGQLGVRGGRLIDATVTPEVDLGSADGIQPVGPAGVLDALAAAAVARTQGVAAETIARALSAFTVDGHRGATVHQGRKTWVDNSKATNPHAADAALAGLDNLIWIAGGQLKGADVDQLVADHAHRFAGVGVLGVDRELIVGALRRHAPDIPVFVSTSADASTAMADVVGWAAAQEATTVLLAPAAASLDMYTGMGQRGDMFAAAALRHDPTI